MNPLQLWNKMRGVPGGSILFNHFIRRVIPYTGTIRAEVKKLEAGYSLLEMKDRRGVRNHLKSIHAVAMMNLAEFSSGLALVSGIPEGARAILTAFEIQFVKKARGTLQAETKCDSLPKSGESGDWHVRCEVRDGASDIVAIGKATWKVGAKK